MKAEEEDLDQDNPLKLGLVTAEDFPDVYK